MTRLDRTNAVHHVYRCFDADDRLIYVGSSANLFGRLTQHRRTSWWAGQTARVAANVYPTGVAAREVERRAIRTENPRWNKSGRWETRHSWDQAGWDDWLTLLLRRKSYAPELLRFVALYARTWGVEPDSALMASVAAEEARYEESRAKTLALIAQQSDRRAQIDREDELSLRRERKAVKAKAKKLAKKAKRAKELVAEYDLAVKG